jgi:diguanylate cyclase (GGDEF)-like protein
MQLANLENRTSVLRLRYLTPLVSGIILMILTLAISLFYFESENSSHKQIEKRLNQIRLTAQSILDETLQNDTHAILSMLSILEKDEKLKLLLQQQQNALHEHIEPLFRQLNKHYKITHFYFIRPDKSILLRAHAPSRFDDIITRTTLEMAEKTREVSHGLELGVLGTFTLRVVKPWYESSGKQLIGYVELGMEIDHIINDLRQIFSMETHVVIYKKFLERERWEEGLKALGRVADWDHFDQIILTTTDQQKLPEVLHDHLLEGDHRHHHEAAELQWQDTLYRMISIPVKDIDNREIGQVLMMSNITDEIQTVRTIVIVVGVSTLLLGLLLILFFSWQARRIGQFIQEDEKQLKDLATIDGLTNLHTRRVFDEFLESEFIRSSRFGHPLSLLLIDIDHFKKVNDTYGHQVGDIVLKKMAERISKEARKVDRVCRYGGEEIALILPETSLDNALKFGLRLNKLIATFPFIANEHQIDLTVSIGVAAYPEHADNDTFLISGADKALYEAKQTGRNRVCVFKDHQDLESS